MDAERYKRQLLVARLQVEAHGDTIANLTTELQLVSDELQRVYSAHQATLQLLAEKHVELTNTQHALDAAATHADGQQAQLASTLQDTQAEVKTLRARCKELAAQQEASTAAMAQLQSQHDTLAEQLQSTKAAHKAQAQQHASIVQDYEDRLHAARTEATRNQQRAELASKDAQELQKLLQQRSTMVEDVVASQTRAIMDANQQRVELLTEELKRLQQQLQAEWQRNGRLEQELSQARLRGGGRAAAHAAPQRDVAHALRAVESCIDATADSGGSPHAPPAHRPLLPMEPTMSSPGLPARVDKGGVHNGTASANASTPLPRDVAAAGTGGRNDHRARCSCVITEALIHHLPRVDNAQAPSDVRPMTLPELSMEESEQPATRPVKATRGKGARQAKRKAAATDDEEPQPAKVAKKGRRSSAAPRSKARLPLVEEVREDGGMCLT